MVKCWEINFWDASQILRAGESIWSVESQSSCEKRAGKPEWGCSLELWDHWRNHGIKHEKYWRATRNNLVRSINQIRKSTSFLAEITTNAKIYKFIGRE